MSEIRQISSKSYRDSLDAVIQSLQKRKVDLSEKHWVFVPDRYTLTAEREIFSALGGAFDVEVLTFNRLFSKYFHGKSYLPRHGAVMLLKRVIEENKDGLTCLWRSAQFKGFAGKLYDTVSLLLSCRIKPEDLVVSDESIKRKIDDVRLIYSKYLEKTTGKHVDAAGRGELLISEVKKRDYSGVHLYFPMHFQFTAAERETIALMCKTASSCDVYKVADYPEKYGDTEFYVSADVTNQLKAVARRIIYRRKNGTDFGEMGIVAPQSALAQAERILKEFSIPFYIDRKMTLGQQALPRFVETLFHLDLKGLNSQDFIALSKNHYCGVEKSDADKFENYCLKYRIDYKGFEQPFVRGDEAEREIPERVREKLAGIICGFKNKLSAVATADDFCTLIGDLVGGADIYEMTARLSTAAGVDLSSVPEKMRSTAALLKEVWGDGKIGVDKMAETFFEGLAAGRIAPLPRESGVVEVGDGGAFIASKLKHVFLIGTAAGVMPPVQNDCAVITDKDIDVLFSCGVTLEPKISDLNSAADREFLFSASSGKSVFIGCEESPDKGVFPVLSAIAAAVAPDRQKENSPEKEEERLKDTAQKGYAAYVAQQCATISNAAETYLISRADSRAGSKGLPFEEELKAALEESGVLLSAEAPFDKYGITCKHDVFFYKNSTTVSRVQDYFACPYRNFLKNAIGLREREDGKISHLDVGNFLHRVIELFVSSGDFSHPEAAAKKFIDGALAENEKYGLEANKRFIERLCVEAVSLCVIVAEQIKAGKFTTLGTEMRFGFGKDSDLDTLEIDAGGKKIALKGIIDRVDKYGNYARVIDYKTGTVDKDFDFSKLYYGNKIQLMIYMKILEKNGYLPAGSFHFPLSVSYGDNEFSHVLEGVYNEDRDIRIAFDEKLKNVSTKSTVIHSSSIKPTAKNGFREFRESQFALSTEELGALSEYALLLMQNAANEIVGGYTQRSPAGGECEYCDYRSVCKIDESSAAERVKAQVNSKVIIDAVASAKGGAHE